MSKIPVEMFERDAQPMDERPVGCLQTPLGTVGPNYPCVYPYCWCHYKPSTVEDDE